MIRNVAIHVINEQPLMADLYALPEASDAGLVCTNVRMIDGKRPTFIDHSESTFFFPYLVIRFLEIPPGAMARHQAEGGRMDGLASAMAAGSWGADGEAESRLPVLVPSDGEVPDATSGEGDLEIDEDFMQRIRDI
jgi:hypothetical protein